MPLTEKEKRVIISPLSFSSKQRKNAKFRANKKIQEILCDMSFLVENHSKISQMFGIDVLGNDILGNDGISARITEPKTIPSDDEIPDNRNSENSDPDLL